MHQCCRRDAGLRALRRPVTWGNSPPWNRSRSWSQSFACAVVPALDCPVVARTMKDVWTPMHSRSSFLVRAAVVAAAAVAADGSKNCLSIPVWKHQKTWDPTESHCHYHCHYHYHKAQNCANCSTAGSRTVSTSHSPPVADRSPWATASPLHPAPSPSGW